MEKLNLTRIKGLYKNPLNAEQVLDYIDEQYKVAQSNYDDALMYELRKAKNFIKRQLASSPATQFVV